VYNQNELTSESIQTIALTFFQQCNEAFLC